MNKLQTEGLVWHSRFFRPRRNQNSDETKVGKAVKNHELFINN